MTRSILATVDDIDTRRETLICFQILPPAHRCLFLYWCCDQVNNAGKTITAGDTLVTITNETGDATESYLDFWQMVSQYSLDVQRALAELERRAAQFSKTRGFARS